MSWNWCRKGFSCGRLIGNGIAVHWVTLEEDLSIQRTLLAEDPLHRVS
ncbi:MAG: hypothetical protein WD097_05500 [Balneolales bacterium]